MNLADGARLAVEESLERISASAPPSPILLIGDDQVEWAEAAIDGSGLLERIEEWRSLDRKGPGGRPEVFPIRALLVSMVLAARLRQPMLATTWRDILYFAITDEARLRLQVDDPPDRNDRRRLLACYRNVRTRFHSLLALVDPSVLPKNRRLTAGAFEREVERRLAATTEDELRIRYERLEWLLGAVIEVSVRALPRDVRRRWKGSVAVDGTPVAAWARPPRRARGDTNRVEVHSADPDAGWYIRDPDQRDTDSPSLHAHDTPKDRRWVQEATFVVMVAERDGDHEYPFLIVGMAPLDRPGHNVGINAIRALTNLRARGHDPGFLTGDRAYSNSRPENYQLPAKALGYDHIFDYKIDQLGRQGSAFGALLVDGHLYCPSMPAALIDATRDYRDGAIDPQLWRERVEARRSYRFRPKGAADPEGHIRLLCPASDGAPTARCDLKPRSISAQTAGRTRIALTNDLVDSPPKCCSQQSITVPPEALAKYRQTLPHADEEWRRRYAAARSTNEGLNGTAKDSAYQALSHPGRRRIRGRAAQSIITAFLVLATNLRMIDSFVHLAVVQPDGTMRRPRARRRRTAPISNWNPAGGYARGDPPGVGETLEPA